MGKKYPFGFLNPLAGSDVGKKLSPAGMARLNIFEVAISNTLGSMYGSDILADHGAWSAIVVKVLDPTDYENDPTLEPYLAEFGGLGAVKQPLVVCHARIEELHPITEPYDEADISETFGLGAFTGKNKVKALKDNLQLLHPIFIGTGAPLIEGELIKVDFKDKVNRRYGIIVERPEIQAMHPGAYSSGGGSAGSFRDDCIAEFGANSAAGDVMGSGEKDIKSTIPAPSGIEARREECIRVMSTDFDETTTPAEGTTGTGGGGSSRGKNFPNPYANEVSDFPVLHPIPPSVFLGKDPYSGYEHIPSLMGKRELASEKLTEGSFLGSLVRMVGGFNPSNKTWSRPLNSYVTLDTFSIGFAHYWAETAAKIVVKFAQDYRPKAVAAWGEQAVATVFKDETAFLKYFAPQGRNTPATRNWLRSHGLTGHHHPKWDWFLAGFHYIAFDLDWIATYSNAWVETYLGVALQVMRDYRSKGYNWSLEVTAGALARCANSGQGGMVSKVRKTVQKLGSSAHDERLVIKTLYTDPSLYNKPDRLKRLEGIFNSSKQLPSFSLIEDYYRLK